METPTARDSMVHKGYHEHRIWHSERILLFPMRNWVFKVINNILIIDEVKKKPSNPPSLQFKPQKGQRSERPDAGMTDI